MKAPDPKLEARARELAYNVGGVDYETLDETEQEEWRVFARQFEAGQARRARS